MKKKNKLLWKESLLNSSGTLFGMLIWVCTTIVGVEAIKVSFGESEWFAVMILIWMLILLNLTKIVPRPIITYEEVE